MKYLIKTLVLILIISCSAEDSCEPTPKLTTSEATEITDVSATVTGTITPPTCDETVTSQGFVYGENELPTIDDNKIIKNGSEVSATLSNLEQNQTYYVRTFFENPTGVYYGNEVIFSTVPGSISFNSTVTSVFPEYAKLSINITDDGGGTVSDVGIYYSTENNVGVDDEFLSGYEFELLELTPDTNYYYVAAANNESGQHLSDIYSFTTLSSEFTSNPIVSEISKNSAILEVKINHNYEFVEEGILYSRHTSNLNIENNTTTVLSNGNKFTISALLPETTYYFKGYTKYLKSPNSEAFYAYSETISFKTAPQSLSRGEMSIRIEPLDDTNRNFDITVSGYFSENLDYVKGFGYVIVDNGEAPDSAASGGTIIYPAENVFDELNWFEFTQSVYGLNYYFGRYWAFAVAVGWDDSKHYFGGVEF